MISPWLILVLQTLFFPLRLDRAAGSFPRALKSEEERALLERYAAGDMAARDALIEHNLRLVAHIAKKCYPERREYNMALQRRTRLPGLCQEGDHPLERSIIRLSTVHSHENILNLYSESFFGAGI